MSTAPTLSSRPRRYSIVVHDSTQYHRRRVRCAPGKGTASRRPCRRRLRRPAHLLLKSHVASRAVGRCHGHERRNLWINPEIFGRHAVGRSGFQRSSGTLLVARRRARQRHRHGMAWLVCGAGRLVLLACCACTCVARRRSKRTKRSSRIYQQFLDFGTDDAVTVSSRMTVKLDGIGERRPGVGYTMISSPRRGRGAAFTDSRHLLSHMPHKLTCI